MIENFRVILHENDKKKNKLYHIDAENAPESILRRFCSILRVGVNNSTLKDESLKFGLKNGYSGDALHTVVYDTGMSDVMRIYECKYNDRKGTFARGRLLRTERL